MNITVKRIFEVYVFALLFFFAFRPIDDPDFWFHLKVGQYVIQNLGVPHFDIFSCTNLGQPYTAHGWLSGVILYSSYSGLGANWLILLFAILAAFSFWIVFKRSNEHIFTRGIAVLLGIWTLLPNIGSRPRVFTLLFVSIYFHILISYLRNANSERLWWLVPLMILWVNLHGAFLVGLIFIFLTIAGILLDAWFAHENLSSLSPRIRILGLILFVCSLVVLINPYGIKIYSHIVGVLTSPVYQNMVNDWLSPNFHESDLFPLLLLILITIAVLILSPKRVRPSELLFFIATLGMALKTQRNAMMFAVVASSLLADYSGILWESMFSRASAERPVVRNGFRPAVLNLVLLLPLLLFVVKLKTVVSRRPTQKLADAPINAVQYLKNNGLEGCTFTEPNVWGAYLIWAAPANPVYIDGRDVYPPEFVREYIEIIQGQRDWHEAFERYDVKNAILNKSSVLNLQLKKAVDWQLVYEDESCLVFTKH